MVAALAVCCTATAGEGNGAKKKSAAKKMRCRLPGSLLRYCPIVSRIKLTEGQTDKVKGLEKESNKKILAAFEQSESGEIKRSGYYKKRGEILEALEKKVFELLSDEQKKKHKTAQEIVERHSKGISKVRSEYYKARRAAGKDQKKLSELRKQYKAKVTPLREKMYKELDSKIGKRSVPAKKPKPATSK
jgi:hypothetical protein